MSISELYHQIYYYTKINNWAKYSPPVKSSKSLPKRQDPKFVESFMASFGRMITKKKNK